MAFVLSIDNLSEIISKLSNEVIDDLYYYYLELQDITDRDNMVLNLIEKERRSTGRLLQKLDFLLLREEEEKEKRHKKILKRSRK